MIYLILAILSSVSVSIFLKIARRHHIQTEQAIAMNYVLASGLTYFLLKPDLNTLHQDIPSIMTFTALGILLPLVFVVMSQAVHYAGIIKTDAAQRLALVLPIIAAFTLFGEAFNPNKAIGVALAFAALLCLIAKPQTSLQTHASKKQVMLSLLTVWFGFGVIDVLLKQVAKMGSSSGTNLFAAFILSGILIFTFLIIKRTQWSARSLLSGVLLGALNFANIWFYINAHKILSSSPTTVFAGMNVGVIALGTLVGAWMFHEKISRTNMLGVALAVASILCLFYLNL